MCALSVAIDTAYHLDLSKWLTVVFALVIPPAHPTHTTVKPSTRDGGQSEASRIVTLTPDTRAPL